MRGQYTANGAPGQRKCRSVRVGADGWNLEAIIREFQGSYRSLVRAMASRWRREDLRLSTSSKLHCDRVRLMPLGSNPESCSSSSSASHSFTHCSFPLSTLASTSFEVPSSFVLSSISQGSSSLCGKEQKERKATVRHND